MQPGPVARRRRRDWARSLSRLVCALFALVGALPLFLGLLARTGWARREAAALTHRLLLDKLELDASFEAELEVLPPALVIRHLLLPSSDGGSPALSIDRVQVSPRLFSLLSGRPDAGDIEVEHPVVRLVIAGGELKNIHFRAPPGDKSAPETDLTRLPLRSLSVTQIFADVSAIDAGVRVEVDDLDVDLSARDGPKLEGALRLSQARVHRARPLSAGGRAYDDDVVCGLRARLSAGGGALLVRRLDLDVRLDADPREGPGPGCEGKPSAEDRLLVALSHLRVTRGPAEAPAVSGHVELQVPLRVAARASPSAPLVTGDVGLDVDMSYSGLAELPVMSGQIRAHEVVLFGLRTVAHELAGRLETTTQEARLREAHVAWADGEVVIRNARIAPLAPGLPVEVAEVEVRNLQLHALVRDLGVTRHAIASWTLESGGVKNFKGLAADPLRKGPVLMGDVLMQTSAFEVTDKAWDNPARRHVVGVRRALVRGRFGFEPYGAVFRNMLVDFGKSHAEVPSITVGFEELLEVQIGGGTRIDFADITPLVSLPFAGKLEVKGLVHGSQSHPRIEGDLKVKDFRMSDMPMADALSAHAEFHPYVVDFTRLHAQKGHSSYDAPLVRLDLNQPSGVVLDAQATTRGMDLRDLLAVFQFDTDPRFTEVHGFSDARASVHFESGGPNDLCKSGVMSVRAVADFADLSLYGETYDSGSVDMDYLWFDRAAEERGVEADFRSVTLKKGRGTVLGSGSLRKGGVLRGQFVAQDVPLARINGLGDLGRAVDGSVSGTGQIGGSLDAMSLDGSVQVSPVRIGQKRLPPSAFALTLVPARRAPPPGPRRESGCHEEIPPPFNQREFDKDESLGVFHVSGQLFGGQVGLDDVQMSRQHHKSIKGAVDFKKFDLGAIAQVVPSFVLSDSPPEGTLSGRITVDTLDVDHPETARARVVVDQLDAARAGYRARAQRGKDGAAPIDLTLRDDALTLARTSIALSNEAGLSATVEIGGQVKHLTATRDLALEARLLPLDVSTLAARMPRVDSAGGKLDGTLSISGRADAPVSRGELRWRDGSLAVRGSPVALEDIDMTARVDDREVRVVQATARAGSGKIQLSARAPLRGFELGEVTGRLEASEVRLAAAEGIDMTVNASLAGSWTPPSGDSGARRRVAVTGNVALVSFLYTKPIAITADLDTLARRGRRTDVSVYDPDDDMVDFSVTVRPLQPLVFRNNLIDAEVSLDSDALTLSGTNQRFGLRGQLRVAKGGRLHLRSNEFDIRQGTIRFDDPTRIAPRVDLTASTDYRRYTTSSAAPAGASGGASGGASAGAGAGTSAGHAGGSWRITLHAHGDAEDLKLDLTSEPDLPQDDIVLLLAIGMTRAELDQLQAANLGSTAALEALSTLSGADNAVKTVIPIIDDFRFGSAYSTRTGRTEPTVTVGKRISDRVRASIITGLSESRDVRSNIEWRVTPTTSILGNYDNLNDVTSQGLGNLGADFRIRLEF